MSRLLIKNIPATATPDSLRVHFSSSKNNGPTITDVHVARKPDGTPRRFAFVGFKTEDQARAAKEWFNGTFWGSQRIHVEVVQGVKDAPAPRPNKRPRLIGPDRTSSSAAASSPGVVSSKSKSKTSKGGDDALTKEFFKVMQPRHKGPAWVDGEGSKVHQRTSPVLTEKKNDITEDDVTTNDAVSDLDWMKSRMTKGILEPKAFEQSDGEDEVDVEVPDSKKPEDHSQEPPDSRESTRQIILGSSRLFMRNLTYSCTSEELRELFGTFGQVEQVHIPLTPEHAPKGIAFVLYARPADAVAAWEALDGTTFQGRLLHILAGVERRKDPAHTRDGKKTLKEERGAKKKRDAGREFNWGMLYMNSDAVVSSIADRMNIPKADILGAAESEDGVGLHNPAVKLALAETHVIQETKRYFEEQGVVLATLSSRAVPRSRTTVLVKNIPYGTTSHTLRELFTPHGDLSRLLIPPTGTLAVVEYVHPDDAARAFRAVAYRRLGNSIVYLEWAPEGLLVEKPDAVDGHTTAAEVKTVTIREQTGDTRREDHAIRPGSTLFVKNLAFSTTTERLAQVFRGMPSFVFARVQTKPAPPNKQSTQGRLSMGYGFVGFADAEAAQRALKSVQDFVLDGHTLHITFAGRGTDDTEEKGAEMAKAKTTKMIVKNIPFEATKKDIRDLFGVYGTLKSVRLPKTFDARTRGFAFLEFTSRHEAENAFAALRHTHLLGRHLVLDWATEGAQDVEALRRNVGIGFGGGAAVPGRKRKLDLAIDDEEIAL